MRGLLIKHLVLLVCGSSKITASHFRYGHISYAPILGGSTAGEVQFTINTAWRTDFGTENIKLYFGDGTHDSTGNFDIRTSASAIGNLTDAAGESYTLHRHTITHTYASSAATPYTADFGGSARIDSLRNSPYGPGGDYGVGITVRLNSGLLSTPQVSIPAIIQMYTSKANSIDIKPFISYSGSDIMSCSYNAGGAELAPLPTTLSPTGFASLPTGLVITNDCKLEWDLTNHSSTSSQFDKYAVSMVAKIVAKSFVQSIDFIIELVSGTPLTCAANGPVKFDARHGETTQASFNVAGNGTVGNITLDTTGLPSGATVGTNASSTALLPAVWEFRYTVPVNAPIGLLSQSILQWNQGALRCFQTVTINVVPGISSLPPALSPSPSSRPTTSNPISSPVTAVDVEMVNTHGNANHYTTYEGDTSSSVIVQNNHDLVISSATAGVNQNPHSRRSSSRSKSKKRPKRKNPNKKKANKKKFNLRGSKPNKKKKNKNKRGVFHMM